MVPEDLSVHNATKKVGIPIVDRPGKGIAYPQISDTVVSDPRILNKRILLDRKVLIYKICKFISIRWNNF